MQVVTNPAIIRALTQLQTATLMLQSTRKYLETVEDLTEKECDNILIAMTAFTTAIESRSYQTIIDITGITNWEANETTEGVYVLGEAPSVPSET